MRHYELLDAAISERRLERGLSWGDLAAQLGISESALRNIRRGRNEPSMLTARRIEDALQWMPGSVDAVLAGGEVTPATAPKPDLMRSDDELDAVEALLEQALAELNRLKREREKPA